jgi:hypothetical protein
MIPILRITLISPHNPLKRVSITTAMALKKRDGWIERCPQHAEVLTVVIAPVE